MSRRDTGRSRRMWKQTASGVIYPTFALRYDFEAASVSKNGSNQIAQADELVAGVEDVVQGLDVRKPVWTDDGSLSGTKDVALFSPDGNLKQLTRTPLAALFGTAGYTLFFLFNRVTAATGSWNMWSYNNGAARGGWSLQTTSGANGRKFEARTSGGTVKSLTFGTCTLDTWELWTIRNWGGGSDDVASDTWFDARVNGVQAAWTGTPWFWIPTSHDLRFNTTTTTAGNDLKIGCARMAASYLSDAQCELVEAEIIAAYGVT